MNPGAGSSVFAIKEIADRAPPGLVRLTLGLPFLGAKVLLFG